MRCRRALRDFGAAAFENDQRFVSRGGFSRDLEQFLRLLKSFNEGGDDTCVFVADQVIEIFLDRGARLIAAGDDVAQADVSVEHQSIGDGRAQSAAL